MFTFRFLPCPGIGSWLASRSNRQLAGIKILAAMVVAASLLATGLVHPRGLEVGAQADVADRAEPGATGLPLQDRAVEAQTEAEDRAALVALYDATGGDSWTDNTGWKSDDPLGNWYGVSASGGRVTHLHLQQNNLTGMLPAELSNLSNLRVLVLYQNTLTGNIPAELSNLSNLTHLNLFTNTLTGSIPTELGDLSNLTNLNLQENTLTGPIPTELGGLSNLKVLSLDNNDLTGAVPSELGNLTKLTNLSLESNNLMWRLPSSLTSLGVLKDLSFQDNAGLCAPLDSTFQNWFQRVSSRRGDNCPPAAIRSGAAAPAVDEPVTVGLTYREAYLARIQATPQEYADNRCIGYDTSGSRASITVPLWTWERADADSGDSNSPDDSTWASVTAGGHPNASFVYLPQSGDDGKFLRASLTYNSPEKTDTTAAIGPIAADNGLTTGDLVSVAAPVGTLAVGSVLSVSLPDSANDERLDPVINPDPERWQWERSDDGSTGWTDVTPYRNCGQPDAEYPLTADDAGKYLRAYVYYHDDSGGSSVLKRAQTAVVGPVAS